jgi:hypothetical protein
MGRPACCLRRTDPSPWFRRTVLFALAGRAGASRRTHLGNVLFVFVPRTRRLTDDSRWMDPSFYGTPAGIKPLARSSLVPTVGSRSARSPHVPGADVNSGRSERRIGTLGVRRFASKEGNWSATLTGRYACCPRITTVRSSPRLRRVRPTQGRRWPSPRSGHTCT